MYSPDIKRTSASKIIGVSGGGVKPSAVQVPRTSEAPIAPLKSVIVASSGEVPGRNTWKICPVPSRSSPPGIGLGRDGSREALTAGGMARPAARVAPACRKLRRERAAARRQKCAWPDEAMRGRMYRCNSEMEWVTRGLRITGQPPKVKFAKSYICFSPTSRRFAADRGQWDSHMRVVYRFSQPLQQFPVIRLHVQVTAAERDEDNFRTSDYTGVECLAVFPPETLGSCCVSKWRNTRQQPLESCSWSFLRSESLPISRL